MKTNGNEYGRIDVVRLGKIEYQKAYDLQLRLLKLRQREAIGDVLLLLEHPPVITLGIGGKEGNIIADGVTLNQNRVGIVRTGRGGDVTYHGPGQLVGYPILDLKYHGRDVRNYIRRLEEVFIRLLQKEYGLTAGRDAINAGVWIGDKKITAIGCAMKRWVTMHGFAFNVNTDLEHFAWIVSCGLKDRGVTSLQEQLGRMEDLALVEEKAIRYFAEVFEVEAVTAEPQAFLDKITELDYEHKT